VDPSLQRSLTRRLRQGDAEAFTVIYEAYRARLFNFLVRMTNQPAVAEELLQETWMRLARSSTRLAEDTDLGAFLYTVARNLARDHARSERAPRVRADVSTLDVADSGPTPESWSVANETEKRLSMALADLAPTEREVILLVCVEGMSQDAVARILDIGHDAVRQRVTRARARLFLVLDSEPVPVETTRSQEEHLDARH
jgi:RNA polymerase sigma-70 factor (ECF subfamily)